MKKVGVILARFQPIHKGHIALIHKALVENDEVLIFIGSANKINARNPIPVSLRKQMVEESITECCPENDLNKISIHLLDDLTDETDDSISWGFYLYSNVVSRTSNANFTIYYSDGYEIVTKWFPGCILRNNVSLSLLARNSIESGISATEVREYIINSDMDKLKQVVPAAVYNKALTLKEFIHINR